MSLRRVILPKGHHLRWQFIAVVGEGSYNSVIAKVTYSVAYDSRAICMPLYHSYHIHVSLIPILVLFIFLFAP